MHSTTRHGFRGAITFFAALIATVAIGQTLPIDGSSSNEVVGRPGGGAANGERSNMPAGGSAAQWTPDYALPDVGQARAIGQTNTAGSVRPSAEGWTESGWFYSNFNSYGAGKFASRYSPGGAYMIAGTGGHGHPDNHGALGFDFARRAWFRQDNSNGVSRLGTAPWAYQEGPDSNGSPWYEVTGSEVPLPPHIYATQVYVPTRGTQGSLLLVTRTAIGGGSSTSHRVHRYDIATRAWSRVGNSEVPNSRTLVESDAIFDAARNVIWYVPLAQHNYGNVAYFDLADDRWKVTASQRSGYPPSVFSNYSRVMLHEGLLIKNVGENGLYLFNPDKAEDGWIRLTVDETNASLPGRSNRWAPFHGKWYSMPDGGGNTLSRITPPADPKAGNWVVDEVTVSGATLPARYGYPNDVPHYERLISVPTLDRLAWIPGGNEDVYLIYPE